MGDERNTPREYTVRWHNLDRGHVHYDYNGAEGGEFTFHTRTWIGAKFGLGGSLTSKEGR